MTFTFDTQPQLVAFIAALIAAEGQRQFTVKENTVDGSWNIQVIS